MRGARLAAVIALLGACATPAAVSRRALLPIPEGDLAFEQAFSRRLAELRDGPRCAGGPPHAVLHEQAPSGSRMLGFCDGRIAVLAERGIEWSEAPERSPGRWRSLAFQLGEGWVRTQVPADSEVRVRTHGDGVRLVGKRFDLWLRPAGQSPLPTPPEHCDIVDQGPDFTICRRGRVHRLFGRIEVAGTTFGFESEPRMRLASQHDAEHMLRALQLIHPAGR